MLHDDLKSPPVQIDEPTLVTAASNKRGSGFALMTILLDHCEREPTTQLPITGIVLTETGVAWKQQDKVLELLVERRSLDVRIPPYFRDKLIRVNEDSNFRCNHRSRVYNR